MAEEGGWEDFCISNDSWVGFVCEYRCEGIFSWLTKWELHFTVIQRDTLKIYRNETEFISDNASMDGKPVATISLQSIDANRSNEPRHPYILRLINGADIHSFSFPSDEDLESCFEAIQVAQKRSRVYRKVTHEIPMPDTVDIACMNERFLDLLDRLRIPSKHRRSMMSLPPERKWRILSGSDRMLQKAAWEEGVPTLPSEEKSDDVESHSLSPIPIHILTVPNRDSPRAGINKDIQRHWSAPLLSIFSLAAQALDNDKDMSPQPATPPPQHSFSFSNSTATIIPNPRIRLNTPQSRSFSHPNPRYHIRAIPKPSQSQSHIHTGANGRVRSNIGTAIGTRPPPPILAAPKPVIIGNNVIKRVALPPPSEDPICAEVFELMRRVPPIRATALSDVDNNGRASYKLPNEGRPSIVIPQPSCDSSDDDHGDDDVILSTHDTPGGPIPSIMPIGAPHRHSSAPDPIEFKIKSETPGCLPSQLENASSQPIRFDCTPHTPGNSQNGVQRAVSQPPPINSHNTVPCKLNIHRKSSKKYHEIIELNRNSHSNNYTRGTRVITREITNLSARPLSSDNGIDCSHNNEDMKPDPIVFRVQPDTPRTNDNSSLSQHTTPAHISEIDDQSSISGSSEINAGHTLMGFPESGHSASGLFAEDEKWELISSSKLGNQPSAMKRSKSNPESCKKCQKSHIGECDLLLSMDSNPNAINAFTAALTGHRKRYHSSDESSIWSAFNAGVTNINRRRRRDTKKKSKKSPNFLLDLLGVFSTLEHHDDS